MIIYAVYILIRVKIDFPHLHVVGVDGRHHYGGAFLLAPESDDSMPWVPHSCPVAACHSLTRLIEARLRPSEPCGLDRSHQDHGHQNHTPLKGIAGFLLLGEAPEDLKAGTR